PRFFSGLGSFDKIEPIGREQRDQFRLKIVLNEYDGIVEQHVQVLIKRAEQQLVFAGVPDTGGQVSIRLLDHRPGQTLVRLVFFKPSLRHPRGEALTDSEIRNWARAGLRRVSDQLSRSPGPLLLGGSASPLKVAKTLITAGVLAPGRPDRSIKQLSALAKWGPTLAGGYAAAAAKEPNSLAIIDERGTKTFAQVDGRATQLAYGLRELSVAHRTKIAVLARNHSAMVESLLACAKLGADVV